MNLQTEYSSLHQPKGAGILDRGERGILRLTGQDRASYLQGMVSNDVTALTPGQSCRAALLDSTGHILADLRVHAHTDGLLVETDAIRLGTVAQILDKFLIMEDVTITDVSADWTILTILGGAAEEIMGSLFQDTGFTVARPLGTVTGFDLWVPAAAKPEIWAALVSAGATPIREQTWEIARVEAGEPIWGHELDESVLLPEADMPDAVSYTKGCYVGQEIVARLRARGHVNRTLRGFLLAPDAPLPIPGDTIHAPEDTEDEGRLIGRVTSAIYSPHFDGRPLALGYVRREYVEPETLVSVHVGPTGMVDATVLTRPFVQE